jgi:hypothetical protein
MHRHCQALESAPDQWRDRFQSPESQLAEVIVGSLKLPPPLRLPWIALVELKLKVLAGQN